MIEAGYVLNTDFMHFSKACPYGFCNCTAPNTSCQHWQGTFCELDYLFGSLESTKATFATRGTNNEK